MAHGNILGSEAEPGRRELRCDFGAVLSIGISRVRSCFSGAAGVLNWRWKTRLFG